jgi:integrase
MPTHYIFSAHKIGAVFNGNAIVEWQHISFDPTRPMTSWRTAWRNLIKEAGLKGLRFHDLRHHVVTKLIESGAPDGVIMSLVGTLIAGCSTATATSALRPNEPR